jgi:hypothetical protein
MGTVYDKTSIPKGGVVRVKQDLYYSNPASGDIYRIGGNTEAEKEQNLRNYYISTGQDPNKIRPPLERGVEALRNLDGSPKVKAIIDKDWYSAKPSASREAFTGLPADMNSLEGQSLMFKNTRGEVSSMGGYKAGRIAGNVAKTEAGAAAGSALAGFLSKKNAPNKPDAQELNRESSGGQLNTGTIINKGLDIFSGKNEDWGLTYK